MFSKNPFELIDNFILNKLQKLLLYMLDYYGLLVGRSVHIASFVIVTYFLFMGVYNFSKDVSYLLLANSVFITLLSYVTIYLSSKFQLKREKEGHISEYNIQVEKLNNGIPSIVYQTILVFGVFMTSFILRNTVNNLSIESMLSLLTNITYLYYLYGIRCYTREREPPMQQTSLSSNMV